MVSDKGVKHFETMMNEYDDYTCDADDYVELVASVKALRRCLKEVRAILPPLADAATIKKITSCLEEV